MPNESQVLVIEPEYELKFVGTFKQPITSYIKLTNPSNQRVGYKIKTTAPKKYCVRPNAGTLEPKQSVQIGVCLQALEFDLAEKNKHKFMVQTMFIPDGENNVDNLWRDVKEETLMGTKLKCVFERTEVGENTAPNTTASAPQSHQEEKAKRIGDSPSVHQEGELQKAAKEVKHLREEESSLRQENLQLKEELLRMRMDLKSGDSHQAQLRSSQLANNQPSMPMLVVIGVVMAMLGIVLGKFIL